MPRRRAILFAATAGAVIVADQVAKALVRQTLDVGESVPVIDGVLWFTHVQNIGGAFGVFRGGRWAFVALAVAVLMAIWWTVRQGRADRTVVMLGLALVVGGTVGNAIDRVVAGTVTDFVDLGWFPVFNIADAALDVGVALIVIWLLFGHEAAASSASADDEGAGQGLAAGEAPSP